MLKNKVLGILNIPIAIYFIFGLFIFIQEYFESGFEFSLPYILPLAFASTLLSIHLFVIYKTLFEKDTKLSFFFYILLTFCPTFYTLLFIGGAYYLASSIIFQISFLILIAIVYYSYKNYSQKLALILSLLALFTMSISFESGFKDEYCAQQAGMTAPDDIKDAFIPASQEDAKLLSNYYKEVKVGDSIAIYSRDKIKCGEEFKLLEAIKGY